MKISNVTIATIAGLVMMSGPSFADSIGSILGGVFDIVHLPTPVHGAPAPSLAAGIPSLLALGGVLLTSRFIKRFRQ